MKSTINLLVLIFGLLLANVVYAESPREQLNQMVRQLQKTPTDHALREQVIRLARETTPEPAVPPEALRHENTGQILIRNAKTRQDYLALAHEYEQALRHAPWVAQLYFGLAEAYEKMADAAVADLVSGTQPRQSCSDETYKNEWQRFDGFNRARENFKYYLLAVKTVDEEVEAMIMRRIAERELSFALWRHQWDTTCCLGCGGKQDSKSAIRENQLTE